MCATFLNCDGIAKAIKNSVYSSRLIEHSVVDEKYKINVMEYITDAIESLKIGNGGYWCGSASVNVVGYKHHNSYYIAMFFGNYKMHFSGDDIVSLKKQCEEVFGDKKTYIVETMVEAGSPEEAERIAKSSGKRFVTRLVK